LWNICDFNIDGLINLGDFTILAGDWLGEPTLPRYDLEPPQPDNNINLKDLALFCENWLQSR
jgi:hypothetical protein